MRLLHAGIQARALLPLQTPLQILKCVPGHVINDRSEPPDKHNQSNENIRNHRSNQVRELIEKSIRKLLVKHSHDGLLQQ